MISQTMPQSESSQLIAMLVEGEQVNFVGSGKYAYLGKVQRGQIEEGRFGIRAVVEGNQCIVTRKIPLGNLEVTSEGLKLYNSMNQSASYSYPNIGSAREIRDYHALDKKMQEAGL